jgi:hypothetical protein
MTYCKNACDNPALELDTAEAILLRGFSGLAAPLKVVRAAVRKTRAFYDRGLINVNTQSVSEGGRKSPFLAGFTGRPGP